MEDIESDLLLIEKKFSVLVAHLFQEGCTPPLSCMPNPPAVWSQRLQEVAHCEGTRRDSPTRVSSSHPIFL